MAYRSTVRKPPFEVTEAHNNETQEAWMDGCLKEGTDQGWRLHSAIPFNHGPARLKGMDPSFHGYVFIWDDGGHLFEG